MSNHNVFLFLILYISISYEISIGSATCTDPNKRQRFCGSECPKSCDNLNPTCPNRNCVEGCFCRRGYVLETSDTNSRCIREEDCNPRSRQSCLDSRKEFLECGPSCPRSCGNPLPTGSCTRDCYPGCYCREGYVLQIASDPTSPCIRPNQCPPELTCSDPLKEFKECGSACPETCHNLDEDRVCMTRCVRGCFCREGYVLQRGNDSNSRCVRRNQCPQGGDQGEEEDEECVDRNKEWRECGTSCPGTCGDPDKMCRSECVRGCFCKPGYVLQSESLTSRCVRISQCNERERERCPSRKVYDTCGTACPKHCGNLNPQICTMQCVLGCFCQPGYVLQYNDQNAPCIRASDCPTGGRNNGHRHGHGHGGRHRHSCNNPRKEFKHCGSSCPPTCGNENPVCMHRCTSGCFCREGYILANDDPNAMCLRPRDCRTNTDETQVRCRHRADRDEVCLMHDAAVRRLEDADIEIISPRRCSDRNRRECTSLEGIQQKAVSDLIRFALESDCNNIRLVNGTERGRTTGRFSHRTGWRLDISDSVCISQYIRREFRRSGDHYCDDSENVYHAHRRFWEILFAEDAGLC